MLNFEEYVNNLKRKIMDKKDLLFVCIGNSNILWDSIGPIVGSNLENTIGKEYVIGDIKNNICNDLDLIYYYPILKNRYIVAIDSAVSDKFFTGEIFISNNPIIMGEALNMNKGIIGDISIKVAVEKARSNYRYIKNIAKFVSEGIYDATKNKK